MGDGSWADWDEVGKRLWDDRFAVQGFALDLLQLLLQLALMLVQRNRLTIRHDGFVHDVPMPLIHPRVPVTLPFRLDLAKLLGQLLHLLGLFSF
jgi:hypothetical protein